MNNMSTVLEFKNVSKHYDVSRNISELLTGIKPKVTTWTNGQYFQLPNTVSTYFAFNSLFISSIVDPFIKGKNV